MFSTINRKYSFRDFWAVCFLSILAISCTQETEEFTAIDASDILSLEFQFSKLTTENVDARVSEVRFLAFKSETGECVKNQLLTFGAQRDPGITEENTRSKSDEINLAKGTYDFLFIANESSLMVDDDFRDKLLRIGNLTEMSLSPFSVQNYEGEVTDRIVMSAYYPGVDLTSGGAQSSHITKNVRLVRSFSKVEVVFENYESEATYKRVKKVELVNTPTQYNVPALPTSYFTLYRNNPFTTLTVENPFEEEDYNNTGDTPIGVVNFYIPELLRYKDTDPSTNKISLHVEGQGFFDLDQDLVDNVLFTTDQARLALDYSKLSDSSAIRNVIYRYTVKLSRKSDLEAVLDILPWTLIDSDKNFTKPKWDAFSIRVGNEVVTDQQEISLKTGEEAIITFKLTEPKGSDWKASLTNGRDFKFTSEDYGEDNFEYKIKVKAANEWTGALKLTEFYIAVDGEELPLWEKVAGNADGEGGIGKRYVFKQIE